jgi:hypothetical protein
MDLMSELSDSISEVKNGKAPQKAKAASPKAQEKKPDIAAKEAASGEKPTEKQPWELDSVSEKEEPTTEEAPSEEKVPDDVRTPEAKARWTELKKSQNELNKLKPEYEALKEEVEKLRATPEKVPEEVENELKELRQFRAAYKVEESPEFKQYVTEPWTEQVTAIQEVAEFAGIDVDALLKATDEPNTLRRAQAIKAALAESTEDVDSHAIEIVMRAADKLHKEVYPNQAQLKAQALEIQNAFKGKEELENSKKAQEIEQKFSASAEQMYTTLESKLKATGLFNNKELAERVKAAKPYDISEKPMEAAYQAQASALLPGFITKYNEVVSELKTVKAALAARGKAVASPSDNSEAPKSTSSEYDGGANLEDELRAVTRRR